MAHKQTKSPLGANVLTVVTVFLMVLVDAYTFIEKNGAFATAQTGNLVELSLKISTGEFSEVMSHITVFMAFALGAFIGQILIERYKGKEIRKTRMILLLQTILLGFLALFQLNLTDSIMLFV